MFGRSPRLPVDLAFGLPVGETPSKSPSQYVESLRSRLEESFQLALKCAEKSGEKNKARFNQRVTPSSLEEGDRVLVQNVRIRGKHKLEDKWEQSVYVVVKRAGDLPVYTVRPESQADGPTRTLNRDLLLPCPFLPASDDFDPLSVTPPRRPRTRSRVAADFVADQDEDDDERDLLPVRIQPAVFRVGGSHTVVPSAGTEPHVSVVSALPTGPVFRPVWDPLPVDGGLSESEVSLSVGGEGLESDAVVGLGVVAPACVPGDLSGDSPEPLGQAGTSPCRDGPSLGAADSCAGSPGLTMPVVESDACAEALDTSASVVESVPVVHRSSR